MCFFFVRLSANKERKRVDMFNVVFVLMRIVDMCDLYCLFVVCDDYLMMFGLC